MGFADQLTMDLARVEFRDYGESVSWTPADGSASVVTAVVDRPLTEPQNTDMGLDMGLMPSVRFIAADVSGMARGDALNFPDEAGGSAVAWTIYSKPQLGGDGTVRVFAYRREPIEQSAPGHRREVTR